MACAQALDQALGDGMRSPGIGHQLPEQGTEDEQREELGQIAAQLTHESHGVAGQQGGCIS